MEKYQKLRRKLVENQMPWWYSGIEMDLKVIYIIVSLIYPEWCDDEDIRHQDGYTIKWKHHTRLALNKLKKNGVLRKVNPSKRDGRWVKA